MCWLVHNQRTGVDMVVQAGAPMVNALSALFPGCSFGVGQSIRELAFGLYEGDTSAARELGLEVTPAS